MTAPAYTTRSDDSMFLAADEAYADVKAWLAASEAESMSESELQRELEPRGREIMRRLMQSHTTLRCQRVPTEEEVVGEDGHRRTHVREGSLRQLLTIFGTIEVIRQGFGGRSMDSRFPVDADLNLPQEKHSLEVRRRCAFEAARGSYDEGVAALARTTGALVAKRQFQQLTKRAAQDFDAFYDTTELDLSAERTERILVMSSDGKGIVMRFDGLRPATQKAAKKSEKKMTTRLSKGEKANRKRMATVCAVYTVAPWVRTPESLVERMRGLRDATRSPRPRPEHKRVWASVTKPAKEAIAEAFEEAHLRDPHDDKRWVMLVDGEIHQLRYVREQAKAIGVELTIIVDFVHVLEYLWKAAYVFNGEGTKEAEQWVFERLLRVLQGKASIVAGGIRRSATLRGLSDKKRENADKCAKYLVSNSQYLRYHEYLADGLPIATGVIEGACRHLIADRMDITGARWGLEGAEAVLRLRSLRSSGDFEEYWTFHEQQERIRNHTSRYAEGGPPKLVAPSSHRHLRLVK